MWDTVKGKGKMVFLPAVVEPKPAMTLVLTSAALQVCRSPERSMCHLSLSHEGMDFRVAQSVVQRGSLCWWEMTSSTGPWLWSLQTRVKYSSYWLIWLHPSLWTPLPFFYDPVDENAHCVVELKFYVTFKVHVVLFHLFHGYFHTCKNTGVLRGSSVKAQWREMEKLLFVHTEILAEANKQEKHIKKKGILSVWYSDICLKKAVKRLQRC